MARASAVAAATALVLSIPAPAFAAAGDQWWSDVYDLDTVHKTTDGSGVTVCVIDGAINADVPEFDGAKLNLKSAVAAADDGTLVKAKSHPTAFYADHGASMVGLIIGQGKGSGASGTGISGVAPGATVNFYDADSDPTTFRLDDSNYPLLINQALKDGCTLFSISISGIELDSVTLQQLDAAGAVVLLGDGLVNSDPKFDGSVTVGAADKNGKPWKGEAQPQNPDVVAPGVNIASGGSRGTKTDARFASDIVNSGSSDATAITAGLLALVKSKYPDATGNQLIQALIHSQGGAESWSATTESGWGTVRLADMLERDPTGWPDINPMLMDRQSVFDAFPESSWREPQLKAAQDQAARTNKPTAITTTDGKSDDSGVPGWAWPTGGVMLAGLTGAIVAARRRDAP